MKTSNSVFISQILFAAGLVFWGIPVLAQAPKSAPPGAMRRLSQADERAIQSLLKDTETAWNQHDMNAFTRAFREDAEGINVVGMYWRGKAALLKHLTDYHATILKDVKEYIEEVEIHPLDGTHAITVAIWKVDGFKSPSGVDVPPCRHRSTLVLAKESDGWKVVHFHNTVIDEAALKEAANSPKQGSK